MTKNTNDRPLKELVEEYNNKAKTYGNPAEFNTVKTFKDKKTALKRLALIDEALQEAKPKKKAAPKKATKSAPKKKKSKPSQAEIDALLDGTPSEGKPKKAKAKKKASNGPSKRRGRTATFEYEAHSDGVAEPREGTLRADCLTMLEGGCTIDNLEDKMRAYRDKKGAEWKVSCRYRALEILKLLSNQNGYGFTEGENGVITSFTV